VSPAERRFLHASSLLVGGTGLVYGWMLWFAEPADEFSIVNHPWQPHALHAHIVLAPLLVFGCALIWRDHVWARVKAGFRMRRRTGLALFALFGPMVLSGYLLQVTVDELWHEVWVWTHVASSLVWLAGYGVHQLSRRRA
jgi:hypothetical protein